MNYDQKINELFEKLLRLYQLEKDRDNKQKNTYSTNDIKWVMEEKLQSRITETMDLEEKKYIIEEELKKYICSKLRTLHGVSKEEEIREMGITWYIDRFYMKLYEKGISSQEINIAIENITLYLIEIISKLQDDEIAWCIFEDVSLIEDPVLKSKEGIISSFITHEETSKLKSFATIWNGFKNLTFNEERKM